LNIAFPAIFVFLLVTPGFVFQRFYQTREVRAADLAPFGSAVLVAASMAALTNFAVVLVASHWLNYQYYLGDAVRLLVGGVATATDKSLSPLYQRLNTHPFEPLAFFFSTNLLAFGLAGAWRFAVWRFRLDHPSTPFYRKLRPPAPWYYLFSGMDVRVSSPDAVVISAVVPFKDVSYLYTGLLVSYELTDKGDLDRLILANAARRKFSDDRVITFEPQLNDHERFYPIEGDCFVLRASEYTTLNVKFLILEDVAEP
jgi:hypothetical protein